MLNFESMFLLRISGISSKLVHYKDIVRSGSFDKMVEFSNDKTVIEVKVSFIKRYGSDM